MLLKTLTKYELFALMINSLNEHKCTIYDCLMFVHFKKIFKKIEATLPQFL